MRAVFPSRKEGKNITAASQLYRFHIEIHADSGVLTYDPSARLYPNGEAYANLGEDFFGRNNPPRP